MAVSKNVYELAQERLELILRSSIQYACRFPEGRTVAYC